MSGPLVKPKKPGSSPLRRTNNGLKRDPLRRSGQNGSANGNAVASSSFSSSSSNGPVTAPSSFSSAGSESGVNYTDFKLRSCTAEEVDGLRHHIMKFHSRSKVNPAKDFTAPIRFHRKDPRNLQFQLTLSEIEERKLQQEQQQQLQLQHNQEKEANANKPEKPVADMSVVAPDGGARRTNQPFQRKTRQVATGDEASRKLRYEEYYPWVMEDFDGKNTWVGNYEAAQSDTYVLFVFDVDGFKMVPADKWYKMTPRNKYTTLTLEEAEQRMEKKNKAVPRWIMKHIGEEQQQQNVNKQINMRRRFKTVDSSMNVASGSSRRGDEDEIDFDEEFADDEEAPIMDGNEEDVKEVEEKIKREQRSANVIGIGNQPDNAMEEDDGDEPKIDKEGKKLMKYLRSLEKNVYYDSDDEDGNPYASEEESEDEVEEAKIKTEDDGIKKEPELQSPSKINSLSLEQPIVKRAKKTFTNLAPGMVVLQLAPHNLARFPRDIWNPNAKRRRGDYDSEGQSDTAGTTKKIKISKSKSPSPGLAPSVSPPPSSSRQQSPVPSLPGDESNPNILTEKDVRDIISTRKVGAKELLGILKPKLKKDPNNNARLKALVTRIAKLSDGVLVLKETA